MYISDTCIPEHRQNFLTRIEQIYIPSRPSVLVAAVDITLCMFSILKMVSSTTITVRY